MACDGKIIQTGGEGNEGVTEKIQQAEFTRARAGEAN